MNSIRCNSSHEQVGKESQKNSEMTKGSEGINLLMKLLTRC